MLSSASCLSADLGISGLAECGALGGCNRTAIRSKVWNASDITGDARKRCTQLTATQHFDRQVRGDVYVVNASRRLRRRWQRNRVFGADRLGCR